MSAFRTLRVLAAALPAAVLAVALLPADGARAADRTVAGGRLDWSVKASFQRYVTGPVAEGGWTLRGGASTAGESQFRFHSASGSYDPADGALQAGFRGGVRFTGHPKPDGTKELDLTISNPTVRVTAGGSGSLRADLRSRAKGSGKVTESRQVPLASLDLSGVDMRGGGTPLTLANVPAKLTAEGAESFAGYYPAGTALDPVSLSADVRAAGGAGRTPGGAGDDEGGASGSPRQAAVRGKFTDAAVDWGVRRTFREYVTGPVARGRWQLSGGARDGGAAYRFPAGTGRYDLAKGELDAEFGGTVRFTGKHLDTALSGVSVRVRDRSGTLSADGTPLVTFPVKALKPGAARDGLLRVTEAPAELTADGAEFFGGVYAKGTDMAPVSLAVALTEDAELPALPDIGTAPSASASPSASVSARPAAADPDAGTAETAASGSGAALPVALTAASLAVLGGVFWYLRGRRHVRTAAAVPTSVTHPDPDRDSAANSKEQQPE
ncbi:Htaa domain protein [Streptomyces armeniacus]|uniref:Htaa domain protein n=1 Tax=Streptomyces armeniacus TaxID=83291 RepID=A0A345XV86_9ACTN|nr:HtaA domain-containing protein [Streptomyces armeniacus]AXK35552.1 Htaa domain protein [Streptomyces armeniacus]